MIYTYEMTLADIDAARAAEANAVDGDADGHYIYSGCYCPIAQCLLRHGWDDVRVRGLGGVSGKPPGGEYSGYEPTSDSVAAVREVINAFDVGSVVEPIGFSMVRVCL